MDLQARSAPPGGQAHELHADAAAKDCPPLSLTNTRFGDVGLLAWMRPEGSERAPLAVICLPGNPGLQFGSSHASAPLISAVVKAMKEARIPVISFDYKGVGMSAPGGRELDPKKWKIPSDREAVESIEVVVGLAKHHVSDRVVLCGYSYGSSLAMNRVRQSDEYAYISLSMGYNVFMFATDPAQREHLKQDMEGHSDLTCKALYVAGDKDRITPLDQLTRLVKARKDGGSGAAIEVVRDGTHDLKGLEAVAADLCAHWTVDLQKELLGAAAVAAQEESEPLPEGPASALQAPGPEPAPALAAVPEVYFDFRVTCLQSDPASVFDSFHATLPKAATVGLLRKVLEPALAPETQVCELEGMGYKVLDDDAPLPSWVTVEEFKGAITVDMILTANQCCEAQAMIKAALERPDVQRKLDQFERDAKNVDAKYGILLTKLLNTEVYPDIVSHFSLPDGMKGAQLLLGAIPAKSDVGMMETWLELERLMRNKAMIARAEEALRMHRAGSSTAARG